MAATADSTTKYVIRSKHGFFAKHLPEAEAKRENMWNWYLDCPRIWVRKMVVGKVAVYDTQAQAVEEMNYYMSYCDDADKMNFRVVAVQA